MKPVITDHALVRWLERVRGFDVEALRAEVEAHVQPFVDVGVKNAPLGGVWLVFEGPKLITVLPDKPKNGVLLNDRGDRNNGTAVRGEPLNWKARTRKRGA